MKKIAEFLSGHGWTVRKMINKEAKDAEFVDFYDLGLCSNAEKFLEEKFPKGLYKHQHESVKHFLSGNNVCLFTPTASGKTLLFQIGAIEIFNEHTDARFLGVLPTKALAHDQKIRWERVMKRIGYTEDSVAKIDGNVPSQERISLLNTAKIVLMTPDVIHTWLLRNVDKPEVQNYLTNLRLLGVDEVHNYSGAFGSNAAYMFRRLKHLALLCGAGFRIVAASATINKPENHLSDLLGEEFNIVGADFDSSKQYAKEIWMVDPPASDPKKVLSQFVPFIRYIAEHSNRKFIAFVDNRKQVEQTAVFAKTPGVEPFKSGFEQQDQEDIQSKLNNGELKGVISTSALEIGINIPNLSLGILLGVPQSQTAYVQRIGRIGRDMPSNIIIVNSRLPHSSYIFADLTRLANMPWTESSLYLHNERIKYIHALCLAMRDTGENDKLLSTKNLDCEGDVELKCAFPDGFERLCNDERNAQINPSLEDIRNEGGDCPHLVFLLRSIDPRYKIERMGIEDDIGWLSKSQVAREAYPGAIYLHRKKSYRVKKVAQSGRMVYVVPSKGGITTPKFLPVRVYPKLRDGEITAYGCLRIIDTTARVQETVVGFKEGKKEYNYPVREPFVLYSERYFSSYKLTSGIFLHIPEFNQLSSTLLEEVSALMFDAFVSKIPYDKHDIEHGVGKFSISSRGIPKDGKFITIFDKNHGSLRLSSRLGEIRVFRDCVDIAEKMATRNEFCDDFGVPNVIELLKEYANNAPDNVGGGDDKNIIEAIRFGSYGIDSMGNRVKVEKIVFSAKFRRLIYKGCGTAPKDIRVKYEVPVDDMQECEDTEKGFYDLDNNTWLENDNAE